MRRLIALTCLFTFGCFSEAELEGRPCPCAEGWTCCASNDTCVRDSSQCPKPSEPKPPGELSVSPGSASLRLGATLEFSASLPVIWSVVEPDGGSVDASGIYRAPLVPGTYHVRASSESDQQDSVVVVGPQALSVAAGKPGGPGHADGKGIDVRFNGPTDLVGDDQQLFVSDFGSIRRLDLQDGSVTTVRRDPYTGHRLALAGSELYSATDKQVFRVSPSTGAQTLVAGQDTITGWADGKGQAARFAYIRSMTADESRLYVSDQGMVLREVSLADGSVKTLAACQVAIDKGYLPTNFQPSAAAPFGTLGRIHARDGYLYMIEGSGYQELAIWKFDPDAGSFEKLAAPESEAGVTITSSTYGSLAFDAAGAPLVLHKNAILRPMDQAYAPVWNWVKAGSITEAGDVDGLGDVARFAAPGALWSVGSTLYVADTDNHKLRKIQISGLDWNVSSVAGESAHPGVENGVGGSARLLRPYRLGVAEDGTLFAAEQTVKTSEGFGDRIRRIEPNGTTSFVSQLGGELSSGHIRSLVVADGTLFASVVWTQGQGVVRLGSDGGWQDVTCDEPQTHGSPYYETKTYTGMAFDGARYLYVANGMTGSIDRIDLTAADGNCLARSSTKSGFDEPRELAIDPAQHRLFLADARGLWKLDLETGELSALGAPAQGWGEIESLAYDPAGVLYVLPEWVHDPDGFPDEPAHRVYALIVETGEIYDVAGIDGHEGVKLGPLPGGLNTPAALALLPDGALAIADEWENVVLVAR